ncbi:MAG: hypothetical protein M3Y82_06260 [Verrucomicrobiota bacterium]|nr:hypothetical protein [Verrucomicrobiota bacterium]
MTFVFLSATSSSKATLLSYEGFDYTPGDSIVGQNGGSGFSEPWQPNGNGGTATNQATSLSYTDAQGNRLVTLGGSLFLQGSTMDATNSAAAQPNRLLSYVRGTNGTDDTTTWVSFLAVRQGPTTNLPAIPSNPYPRSANLSLFNSLPSNKEKLAMGNTALTSNNVVSIIPTGNMTNAKPSTISYSRTNLIVVRIDHIAGTNFDNAYLFVNPLLGSEPTLSQADTNSLGAFDFSFNRIRPFAGGDRSTSAGSPYAELVLDEIRIGTTYADVAPFVSAPVLGTPSVNGTNVTLNWSAMVNASYELQSNTNLGTTNWLTVTNVIATSTNLSVNVIVPPNDPQRFYRVRTP